MAGLHMYPLIAVTLYKQLHLSTGIPTANLLVTKLFPCFAKHSEIKPALSNNPIPQKPNPVLILSSGRSICFISFARDLAAQKLKESEVRQIHPLQLLYYTPV